jgi:hypothetical protein
LFYFLTFPFFVVCACIRLAGWRTLPLCLAVLINWLTTVLSLVRFRVQGSGKHKTLWYLFFNVCYYLMSGCCIA